MFNIETCFNYPMFRPLRSMLLCLNPVVFNVAQATFKDFVIRKVEQFSMIEVREGTERKLWGIDKSFRG